MKLLPLSVLALASLLTSSTIALQDELAGQAHLPLHYGHAALSSASEASSYHESNRIKPSLSFQADRPSTSAFARRASAAHKANELERRSIWQVLFGRRQDVQKRSAAPSTRLHRRYKSRIAKSRRSNNSCKTPTSSSSSSLPPSVNATSSAAPPATTTAAPSPTNDANQTKTSTNKIMAGYWPDWVSGSFPASRIDFTKFDIVNYAFALPMANFDLSIPTDPSGGLLRGFVAACKAGNTKAVLSIGGWGGSTYFSPAVRTASSRATFIGNIVKYYNQYSLDGIDLDWEYPNNPGPGNQYDPSDAANFQTFLQELRTALPRGALLTAAVAFDPWTGSNGQPVKSVARAAAVMDYIMIMNYDVWGSSAQPGPNGPLANLCGNSTQPGANAAAGVKAWSAAGMRRDKILLGIPAYGYLNQSSKRSLRQRATTSPTPGHRHPAASAASASRSRKVGRYDMRYQPQQKRAVTLYSMSGSTSSGQINFNTIVSSGALKLGSDGLFDGAGGYTKYWDDCSNTPFLSDGTTVVTYDDSSSVFDKGAFATAAGIGGISMWSIDGDTNDWALTNAAIAGMSS